MKTRQPQVQATLYSAPDLRRWRGRQDGAFLVAQVVSVDYVEYMLINEIIWHADRVEHIGRHGISPVEFEEVCFGRPLVLRAKAEGKRRTPTRHWPLHVHVRKGESVAKFWLKPEPGVAESYGMTSPELRELLAAAIENVDFGNGICNSDSH